MASSSSSVPVTSTSKKRKRESRSKPNFSFNFAFNDERYNDKVLILCIESQPFTDKEEKAFEIDVDALPPLHTKIPRSKRQKTGRGRGKGKGTPSQSQTLVQKKADQIKDYKRKFNEFMQQKLQSWSDKETGTDPVPMEAEDQTRQRTEEPLHEGEVFRIHASSLLLSAASLKFKKMFTSESERHVRISVQDEEEALLFILMCKYIYTFELPSVAPPILLRLMVLAEVYQVGTLLTACGTRLTTTIKDFSAADWTMGFIARMSHPEWIAPLHAKARKVLIDTFTPFDTKFWQDGGKKLCSLSCNAFVALLGMRDELGVVSENSIYQAVRQWVTWKRRESADEQTGLQQAVRDMFPSIRWHLISPNFFLDVVRHDKTIADIVPEEWSKMLLQVLEFQCADKSRRAYLESKNSMAQAPNAAMLSSFENIEIPRNGSSFIVACGYGFRLSWSSAPQPMTEPREPILTELLDGQVATITVADATLQLQLDREFSGIPEGVDFLAEFTISLCVVNECKIPPQRRNQVRFSAEEPTCSFPFKTNEAADKNVFSISYMSFSGR